MKRVWMRRVFSLAAGKAPDVSFVPPLMRRRFSPLQKEMFFISHVLAGNESGYSVFFASRDGEQSLTHIIANEYNADGTVSPGKFSTSVHNAAPGLYSIFTENQSPYTAIAGGEETIECSLLEVLLSSGDRLWVYAEETGGGYGCGAFFTDSASGAAVTVAPGDKSRPAVTFADMTAFLSGAVPVLRGRFLTLTAETAENAR
jgi:hypothetical protein